MPRQKVFMSLLPLLLLLSQRMSLAQSSPLSLQQMVAASGFILSGKVVKVWSERDPASGFIVTNYTVAVEDAVRGVGKGHFTFKQYGGSYNGLNVFVADMSYFSEGEEVMAFLYPASLLGLTSPIGVGEGKLTIQRDRATGKKFVAGNLLHVKMLAPHLDAPTASLQTAPLMEYQDFIKLVREMAAGRLP
ncbi:MAG: hypothetical protein ONB46_19410 [candidate division KSB1 bacterium]|nr:hypothetical protein [candidate division KSB1 bacterium]MDZ7368045.1 hypothetical protein [candidate division KSB1 bacterium]MDZ7405729.1 hypothetical protein [candidate division KSB1 bacterium]